MADAPSTALSGALASAQHFDINSQMPSCVAASQLRSEAATHALLRPWLTVDPFRPFRTVGSVYPRARL